MVKQINDVIEMLEDSLGSSQQELVIDVDDQLTFLVLLRELVSRRSDARKRSCHAADRTCYCGACVTLQGRLNDDPCKDRGGS